MNETEARAIIEGTPELAGPQTVLDASEEMFDAIVPEHPYELDYLAGRICLSIEETQLALGIGARTMATALRNGEIPSVKVGGRRLIPRRALERHLEALAYASSGALDAWQTALIQGQTSRLKASRRRATDRRKYLKRRLNNARKAIEEAGSDVARDVLLSMRTDLAALERERAVTDRFVRDVSIELDGVEDEYEAKEQRERQEG